MALLFTITLMNFAVMPIMAIREQTWKRRDNWKVAPRAPYRGDILGVEIGLNGLIRIMNGIGELAGLIVYSPMYRESDEWDSIQASNDEVDMYETKGSRTREVYSERK